MQIECLLIEREIIPESLSDCQVGNVGRIKH